MMQLDQIISELRSEKQVFALVSLMDAETKMEQKIIVRQDGSVLGRIDGEKLNAIAVEWGRRTLFDHCNAEFQVFSDDVGQAEDRKYIMTVQYYR